ncbi:hypothetical protein NECAME_16400, partial [Necator americanus]
YEPLNKFLLVRSADLDATLRFPLSPFRLVNARTDFPQLCVGVQSTESNDKYEFSWVKFEDRKVLDTPDTLNISLFDNAKLDVAGMSQIGKDSLLFAYRNKVNPNPILYVGSLLFNRIQRLGCDHRLGRTREDKISCIYI